MPDGMLIVRFFKVPMQALECSPASSVAQRKDKSGLWKTSDPGYDRARAKNSFFALYILVKPTDSVDADGS